MGVVWREECTAPQRDMIERVFQREAQSDNPPPRVLLFRRELSPLRAKREPNTQELLAIVAGAEVEGTQGAFLVTPAGQCFPIALTNATAEEIRELR